MLVCLLHSCENQKGTETNLSIISVSLRPKMQWYPTGKGNRMCTTQEKIDSRKEPDRIDTIWSASGSWPIRITN